jgi:hypothetical protein
MDGSSRKHASLRPGLRCGCARTKGETISCRTMAPLGANSSNQSLAAGVRCRTSAPSRTEQSWSRKSPAQLSDRTPGQKASISAGLVRADSHYSPAPRAAIYLSRIFPAFGRANWQDISLNAKGFRAILLTEYDSPFFNLPFHSMIWNAGQPEVAVEREWRKQTRRIRRSVKEAAGGWRG